MMGKLTKVKYRELSVLTLILKGGLRCCKACIVYKTHSAVVTDMTVALTLGVWYVEAC